MRFRLLVVLGLALACAAGNRGAAWAQTASSSSSASSNPVVQVTKTDTRTLQSALKALASQAHVAFVVEGHPYQALLPESEIPTFPEEGLPLPEAVAQVAAAFDYAAERRGGVFLLRKRYSRPEDLPGVTPQECALSAAAIARLLAPFDTGMSSVRFPQHPAMRAFIASLTPEQLAVMGSANVGDKSPIVRPIETGLPVSALAPGQQQFMRQFVLLRYTGSAVENARRAAGALKRLVEGDPVFRRGEQAGVTYLGYELPGARESGEPVLIPLSNPEQAQVINGQVAVTVREEKDGAVIAPSPDPTEPVFAATKDDAASGGSTLKEIAAGLAARNAGKGDLRVEAALADKPVLLIGGEAESPAALFSALAEVYGLRVHTETDDALWLRRPTVQAVGDVGLLREALRRALPLPLVRAVDEALERTDARRRETLEKRSPSPAADPARRAARDQAIAEQVVADPQRARSAIQPLRNAAVRVLRAQVEPRLRKSPEGRVVLSGLPLEAQRAFATVLFADFLMDLEKVAVQPLPRALAQFNHLHITGRIFDNQGRRWFSLFLSLPTPDGKLLVSQGGIGMRYPED